jgi:hypothetical protein
VRDAILRGSLHSAALRSRVNSGRLAEPAVYGDGHGDVGHPLPPGVPARPLAHGFAVARLESGDVLVRPDGYVAARVRDDSDSALAELLRPRECERAG